MINKIKKHWKNLTKRLKIIICGITALVAITIAIPPLIVYSGKYKIYTDIAHVKETRIAIVFGAGVNDNYEPSDMLEDRLLTALELYENDKIEKILVSGDNRTSHYNEPQVMYEYLLEKGVDEDDIVRDYAGRRTYDTCYRANKIFGVNEAILISQGYHLPRAIFLCEQFSISSTGYSATRRPYFYSRVYKSREILALYKSVLDVYILKPIPVLGEVEKIH